MYYNKVGTPDIMTGQGDYVGSIEDETLRSMAIDGLNCDCIDSQELEDAQDEIDELRDKIRVYEKEIATLKKRVG